MKIGMIGLGKMGSALAYRLHRMQISVIGYDPSSQAQQEAELLGITIVKNVAEMTHQTQIIWLMVPAGKIVDDCIEQALSHLRAGAIIIDGGNSHYADSIRRATYLATKNVHFLDCGTSGGLFGKEYGFCLMIGGNKKIFEQLNDIWYALAAPQGYGYVGPSGAGHYVKMVHNGIEYALLQAYAEGIALLHNGHYKDLDLTHITELWNHGALIRSFLLELFHEVVQQKHLLDTITGEIAESGTGAWMVQEAHKQNIPVPIIEKALAIRAWSRETGGDYATKLVALMRNKFGGHPVKTT